MMMGGLAYRLGKIATLQAFSSLPHSARFIPSVLAPLVGLSSEVTAFQGTDRLLTSLSEEGRSNPNLLRWHGEGGFSEGVRNSFIDFGVMKGVGHCLRGSNLVTQHLSQDLSMVAGHTATAFLGWTPHSDQSFIQQILHAETTNIQLGIGNHLGGLLTRHRLQLIERQLEHQLEAHNHRGFSEQNLSSQERLRMATPPADYLARITERLGIFPTEAFSQLEARTLEQWRMWESTHTQSPARTPELEKFIGLYTQVALAHFGNQTPRFLEFNEDIFQFAKMCFESGGFGTISQRERIIFMRFFSEQPGRMRGNDSSTRTLHTYLRASSLARDELINIRRDLTPGWEEHRNTHTESLSLSERESSTVSSRSDTLLEAYISYLHAQYNGSFPAKIIALPFQPSLFEQCLSDAAAIPYPESAIKIVKDYLQAAQAEGTVGAPIPPPLHEANIRLGRIPLSREAFTRALPNELWSELLQRVGISQAHIDEANLGVGGSTTFQWGTQTNNQGNLRSTGKILDLISIIAFINSRGRGLIDPFDAIKLTHREMLEKMEADAEGNIIIRYPTLLDGVPPEHFTLATLLLKHLSTLDEANDGDLAKQWGVSPDTVREYRNGNTRKMNIITLRKLHEGLCPKGATAGQRDDLWNLLVFLRYRPFFDAYIPIISGSTGELLVHSSAIQSDCRVVLVSAKQTLRELDLSRRVPFERDPFAAVMDGTVNQSFELLNTRLREFELVSSARVVLPEQSLSPAEVTARIEAFRARHEKHQAQLVKYRDHATDLANNLLKPGQVREMETFYHEFFRFTELVCIQAIAQGNVKYENAEIEYLVTVPSAEQGKGVRLEQSRENPNQWKAFVVIEDIIEQAKLNPDDFNPEMVTDLVELRVLHAYQAQAGMFNGNPVHNQKVFEAYLREVSFTARHPESITWHTIVTDATADWTPQLIEKGNDPVLHRIQKNSRGRGSSRENRQQAWFNDLTLFANENGYAAVGQNLRASFERYLETHPSFMTRFSADALTQAILANCGNEAADTVAKIETGLQTFLLRMGLPHSKPATDVIPPITEEGFANILFATYLQRYHELNPIKGNVGLIDDANLMEEVFADRVGEAAQFRDKKESIFAILRQFIDTYNRRPGLLFIRPLPEVSVLDEPFPQNIHTQIFARCIGRLQQEQAGLGDRISRQHIFATLGLLRDSLRAGEAINEARIQQAFETVRARLAAGEVDLSQDLHALHLRFLGIFCHEIQAELIAIHRLADLIPAYVVSKGYESELEQSQTIGAEIRKLFIEYASSATLANRAPSLKEVVTRQVNARYARYDKIREDVIRDMQTLLLHSLRHYREQYDLVERDFDLALDSARRHASLEQFWNEFVDVVQRDNPTISTKDELLERVDDLSRFLPHILPNRAFDLREKIETAVREIEALESAKAEEARRAEAAAIEARAAEEAAAAAAALARANFDPTDLLAQEPSSALLIAFPELAHVPPTEIENQARLCTRLAHPAARDLLQILAFLRLHGGEMHMDAHLEYDDLVLEIATQRGEGLIDDASKLSALMQDAHRVYEKVRAEARPLTLLRFYPEIQRKGEIVVASERSAGERLIRLISEKEFPSDQAHEAFQMIVGSREISTYHDKVARAYTETSSAFRSRVQAADEAKLEVTRPHELTAEQNRWLDAECPELYLIDWTELRQRTQDLLRDISQRFPENSREFESLLSNPHFEMVAGLGRLFNQHLSDAKGMEVELQRLQNFHPIALLLVSSGAKPEHVAVWAEREIRNAYSKIRDRTRRVIGHTKIAAVLPEVKAEALPKALHYPEFPEVNLRSIPESLHVAARIAQIMARVTDAELRRKYEDILLRAESLEATLSKDQVEQHLQNTQSALAQFHLENRAAIRADLYKVPRADTPSIPDPLSELTDRNSNRHELNIFTPTEIDFFDKTLRSRIRSLLQNPQYATSLPFGIAEAGLPNGKTITAVLDRANYQTILRTLDRGKTFRMSADDGSSIISGEPGVISVPSRVLVIAGHGLIRSYLHLNLPFEVVRMLELAEMVPGLGRDYRLILEQATHWFLLGVNRKVIETLIARKFEKLYTFQQNKIVDFMNLGPICATAEVASVFNATGPITLDSDIPAHPNNLRPELLRYYQATAKVFTAAPLGDAARQEFIEAARGRNPKRDCAMVYLKYRPEILRLLALRNEGNEGPVGPSETPPPAPSAADAAADPTARAPVNYFELYPELELIEAPADWQDFNGDEASLFLLHLSGLIEKSRRQLSNQALEGAIDLQRVMALAIEHPDQIERIHEVQRVYETRLRDALLQSIPRIPRLAETVLSPEPVGDVKLAEPSPTLARYFARYPELEIPEIAERGSNFEGDISEISGRLLFTLKTAITRSVSKKTRKKAEEILAMAPTIHEWRDEARLEERLKKYDAIRSEIVGLIPALERVQILPEFRLADGNIENSKAFGKRVVRFISERTIPEAVDQALSPYIKQLNAKKVDKGIPQMQAGFARVYLREREKYNLANAALVDHGEAYEIGRVSSTDLQGIPFLGAEAWRAHVEQICVQVVNVEHREALRTALSHRSMRVFVSVYAYSQQMAARIPEWAADTRRSALSPFSYLEVFAIFMEAGYTPYFGTNLINGGVTTALHNGLLAEIHRYQKDPRMAEPATAAEAVTEAPSASASLEVFDRLRTLPEFLNSDGGVLETPELARKLIHRILSSDLSDHPERLANQIRTIVQRNLENTPTDPSRLQLDLAHFYELHAKTFANVAVHTLTNHYERFSLRDRDNLQNFFPSLPPLNAEEWRAELAQVMDSCRGLSHAKLIEEALSHLFAFAWVSVRRKLRREMMDPYELGNPILDDFLDTNIFTQLNTLAQAGAPAVYLAFYLRHLACTLLRAQNIAPPRSSRVGGAETHVAASAELPPTAATETPAPANVKPAYYERYSEFELLAETAETRALVAAPSDRNFLLHLRHLVLDRKSRLKNKAPAMEVERAINAALAQDVDAAKVEEIQRLYDTRLRNPLLNTFNPLERVSLYPEFRNEDGSRADNTETGRRLLTYLDDKNLPEEFYKAQSNKAGVVRFFREVTRAAIPGLHEDTAHNYLLLRDEHKLHELRCITTRYEAHTIHHPQSLRYKQEHMPELPLLDQETWSRVSDELRARAGNAAGAEVLNHVVDQPDMHFEASLYYLSERLAERFPEWARSSLRPFLDPVAAMPQMAIFLEAGYPPTASGFSRVRIRAASRLQQVREAMIRYLIEYYGQNALIEAIPEFTRLRDNNGWHAGFIECFSDAKDRALAPELLNNHLLFAMCFFASSHNRLPKLLLDESTTKRNKLYFRLMRQGEIGLAQEAAFLWFYFSRRHLTLPYYDPGSSLLHAEIRLPLIPYNTNDLGVLARDPVLPTRAGASASAPETAAETAAEGPRRAWPVTAIERRVAAFDEIQAEELLDPILPPEQAAIMPAVQTEFQVTAKAFRRILRLTDSHPARIELYRKLEQYEPLQSPIHPDQHRDKLIALSNAILEIYEKHREALEDLPPAEREDVAKAVEELEGRGTAYWELKRPRTNPQAIAHRSNFSSHAAAAHSHSHYLLSKKQIFHVGAETYASMMAELSENGYIKYGPYHLERADLRAHGVAYLNNNAHRVFIESIFPRSTERIFDIYFDHPYIEFATLRDHPGDLSALGAPLAWVLAYNQEKRAIPLFLKTRTRFYGALLEGHVRESLSVTGLFAARYPDDIEALRPKGQVSDPSLDGCFQKIFTLPEANPHRRWLINTLRDLDGRVLDGNRSSDKFKDFRRQVLTYFADHIESITADTEISRLQLFGQEGDAKLWRDFPELETGAFLFNEREDLAHFYREVLAANARYFLNADEKALVLSEAEKKIYDQQLRRKAPFTFKGISVDPNKPPPIPMPIDANYKVISFLRLSSNIEASVRAEMFADAGLGKNEQLDSQVVILQRKCSALFFAGVHPFAVALLYTSVLREVYAGQRRTILEKEEIAHLIRIVGELPEFAHWPVDPMIELVKNTETPETVELTSHHLRFLAVIAYQQDPIFSDLQAESSQIQGTFPVAADLNRFRPLLITYLMDREKYRPHIK